MSLPALFSLIFAALLGLLPIFLLVGRRAIASRLSRRRESGQDGSPSPSEPPTSGDLRAPQGRAGADATAEDQPPPRLAISGTGDPAGESAILDRLIRERRAAAEPNRGAAGTRRGIGRPYSSPIAEIPRDSGRMDRTETKGARIEARLARLSVLQRGVVYREILGPPVGLRAPGEHERY